MQGRSDRGKAGYPMCLLFWRFARIFQASPIQEPACSWRRKMGNSWPQMEDKPPLCFGWAPLFLPTPSLQWKTTSGQTDRKPSMKVPKREAPRLFGGGTVFLRENHPHNHHDSYHERATWNWYQKQHYKDSLSLVLRRPTATAPGADSELFFLIDFSATTYPGPKPCLSLWLAGTLPVPGAARGTRHDGDGAPRPCCNTNRWLLHRAGEIQALSSHGIGGNVLQLFSLEISIRIAVMSAPSSRLPTWDHKHFVNFFFF